MIGRLPAPAGPRRGRRPRRAFYVLGGRGDAPDSQRRAIWAIDPRAAVRRAGRLPVALSDLGAAASGGRLIVAGGRDRSGTVHARGLRPGAPRDSRGRRDAPPRVARTRRPGGGAARACRPHPALLDRRDVYAADRPGALSPVVAPRPARASTSRTPTRTPSTSSTSAPARIVRHFAVGALPQHVTPSWDLRTLWVTNDLGNSLTPIDPRTGRPGRPVPVADPYNLYFTADGRRAIVVAEARRELDFREPHTMRLRDALRVPSCAGRRPHGLHGRRPPALVSCEFAGRMIVVDLQRERVVRTIALRRGAMPQDVKLSPDGRTFYVADMASNGVWLIDARRLARGRASSRRARRARPVPEPGLAGPVRVQPRRGHDQRALVPHAPAVRKWRIPGGGSPDMGGVSADGRVLWLTGRYDSEVYAISTRTGHLLHRIPVGHGPHGMCVWPQPGRYSIGHTGILR